MFLILAGLAGFLAGLLTHVLTWSVRLKYPVLTTILGILGAVGLTWFCLLFFNSDIANMVRIVLVIFWALALLLGALQALALQTPWWRGVLGVFFEMGLTFLLGAVVNLTLQRYIEWLNERFPGVDVYAVINAFLWTMIITLLVLAVVRPLVLLRQARPG
jgi:hypothetical protein